MRFPIVEVLMPTTPAGETSVPVAIGAACVLVDGIELVTTGPVSLMTGQDDLMTVTLTIPVTRASDRPADHVHGFERKPDAA